MKRTTAAALAISAGGLWGLWTGSCASVAQPWPDQIIQSTAYHGDLVVHRFTLEDPRAGLRYRINGVEHVRNLGPGQIGLWVMHARGDEFHVVD